MILNVSGRTDIVAFYSEWFMNRYREGFVDVRNPFYKKSVSRIYFSNVDLILFCTKNPIPIVKYLSEFDKPIVFHITLTPYKKDIEPNVPPKGLVIEAIKKISSIIGSDNVYIRYDPIFINEKYSIDYHTKAFDNMCKLLNGYVKHIIVSFIDDYKNVRNNKKFLNYRELTQDDYKKIGLSFSASAKNNGMTVQTCCEDNNLIEYGFVKGECMSFDLAYKLRELTPYSFRILENQIGFLKTNFKKIKDTYNYYKPESIPAMPIFPLELLASLYIDMTLKEKNILKH